MPEPYEAFETIGYWKTELAAAEAILTELTGAPGFSVGGLSVDQKTLYDNTERRVAHCRQAIQKLENGGSSFHNSVNVSNSTPGGGY